MIIQVRLFAQLRDAFATDVLIVDIPEDAKLGDLRRHLHAMRPHLAAALNQCQVALDHELVTDDVVIKPNSEIAWLPPVSGG